MTLRNISLFSSQICCKCNSQHIGPSAKGEECTRRKKNNLHAFLQYVVVYTQHSQNCDFIFYNVTFYDFISCNFVLRFHTLNILKTVTMFYNGKLSTNLICDFIYCNFDFVLTPLIFLKLWLYILHWDFLTNFWFHLFYLTITHYICSYYFTY